jgi:CheY-like chemotaxis protein
MTSVLVVDDEPTLGRAVQRGLAAHGYDARLCGGTEEAIAVLCSESIDVLVTDLRLVGTDGIDLLQRTRDVSAHTRSVLMSGHATAREYQRALELGAVRVLCKPFTVDELVRAVRQAADCELAFWGNLHGLVLSDVLQMLHYSRRALLLVVHGPRAGRLYFRDGELFHAECGSETGEEALAALLALPAGMLTTEVLPETTSQTITRGFEALLLDAARAVDERSGHLVAVARSSSAPVPITVPDVFAVRPPRNGHDVFARGSGIFANGSGAVDGRREPPAPMRFAPPERASASFDRGLELLRRKDLRGALAEWQRAVELEPDNRTYRANLRRLERLVEPDEPG